MEGFLDKWWSPEYGEAPKVINDHLVTGNIGRGLKWKLTYRTNRLLKEHGTNHKFGKSGQPKKRAYGNDYKNEKPFTNMFLLYESESKENVAAMEVYYIKKYMHLDSNHNVSTTDEHEIVSHNGKYYLYLVI